MDVVSDVLTARAAQRDGMTGTVGASVLAHGVLLVALVMAPDAWSGSEPAEPERVMTISLGGPVGPRDGGMTQMGGRPVQALAETKSAVEPLRAPAARAPEMVEPKKEAVRKPEAKVADTVKTPAGRTPTKGEELRKGSAVSAENTARGQGFGLSSGGGGTGSYLDVADFCCPEYIGLMVEAIRSRWDPKQQAVGTALVRYTIERDGKIVDVRLEKSSGYSSLDFFATRAVQATRTLLPLPAAFDKPTLTVYLAFNYERQ